MSTFKSDVDEMLSKELSSLELFGALVGAFALICRENDEQLHLVSASQADEWRAARASFQQRLETIGQRFEETGVWEQESMEQLQHSFTGARHQDLTPAPPKTPSQNEKAEANSWLQRLRKI